jgi:hypothetical protein
MNILSSSGINLVAVTYKRNKFPPPYNVTKVTNLNTGELIREIPKANKNCIIDTYV